MSGIQDEITKLKLEKHNETNQLKDIKAEIERIQSLLERCKTKMQKDFEQWLQLMMKQRVQQSVDTSSTKPQTPRFL